VIILAVGVVWPQYFPESNAYRLLLPVLVLWITFRAPGTDFRAMDAARNVAR